MMVPGNLRTSITSVQEPGFKLFWIPSGSAPDTFPPVERALREPDGLLAAGGDLSVDRLLNAYRCGIFPWYSDPQPILWWSPDPRCVILPGKLHVSRSLHRTLRRGGYDVSTDTAFEEVIRACAGPRRNQPDSGTWITNAMQAAYLELHHLGYAHSVEVRMDGELAGGVYGVTLGRAFFGESMFSCRPNASKIALAWLSAKLSEWGYELFDCQVHSAHLARLGAVSIPRAEFIRRLQHAVAEPGHGSAWAQARTSGAQGAP